MLTEVPGIRVGHWTDSDAVTGCTVVVLPEGAVASGEVRGGAPATREFALLDPLRTVAAVDAVVLSGGSAFGLAAADGVVRHLEESGRGFPVVVARVPIVVGLSLFDLAVGDATVRPDAAAGYTAAAAASDDAVPLGRVGAGTGATIGKWRGRGAAQPGGLVGAVRRHGDLVVACLVAVNALGDPLDGTRPGVEPPDLADAGWLDGPAPAPFGNTTIGVVATNAALTKPECHLVAQSAHDGLARSLAPVHTASDGDAFVAAATGSVAARADAVRELAATVVAEAVRSLRT
ncbi:P1 family peptidase [Actinomarinicola tropica]|uniref:Peptidase S58 family protein n=1 Tax=Actinomarinicola tropica TaxID=2789776 RepID=A0A5Q2RE57_9ACTN|nr:P1 family peptidase [Actinomarinicola tropica]QGG93903.1 peptidase S58 family protein [Actinomarinicola tropica]